MVGLPLLLVSAWLLAPTAGSNVRANLWPANGIANPVRTIATPVVQLGPRVTTRVRSPPLQFKAVEGTARYTTPTPQVNGEQPENSKAHLRLLGCAAALACVLLAVVRKLRHAPGVCNPVPWQDGRAYGTAMWTMGALGASSSDAQRAGDRSVAETKGDSVVGESMAMYARLTAARAPVSGFFRSEQELDICVQYSQYDYTRPGADARMPSKRAYLKHGNGFASEVGSDVLMQVPHTKSGKVAIFKAPSDGAVGAPTAGWVEIWAEAGLERSISLGSRCGPPLADAWFGGAQWSPDGTQLVFVADPIGASRTHWGTGKADEDPTHPLGLSLQFRQKQDWGESYTNKVFAPKVWTIDLESESVRCLVDPEDGTLSCGQATWLSETEVLYVAWQSSERLGIVYCHQRRSQLYSVAVPASDSAAERKPPQQLTADAMDFSCRSPRVHPNGDRVVFLSREPVGPHFTAARLRCMTVATKEVRTVVDVVEDPRGGFPGLYITNLPQRCWYSDTEIVCSTDWAMDEALVRINIDDGTVDRITSPTHPALHSISVLDVSLPRREVLVSVSTPTTPPEVFRITEGDSWRRLHAAHPASAAAADMLEGVDCERVAIATDDGAGASHFDTMVLSPPAAASAGPSPLVLFVHGGPHSSVASRWTAAGALLALSGYTVAFPNYRGSTGYGERALGSLPTKIGDQDVRDLMTAVDALTQRDSVDPQRLAVIGGSHGGFLSCHLTSKPGLADRFKATVMRNPVTNLNVMIGISDIEDWVVYECGLGTPDERIRCCGGVGVGAITDGLQDADLRSMWAKSPMSNVHNVKAATLMLLGKGDRRVPPSQGQAWVRALRLKGDVKVDCYEYDDNEHPISRPFADADVWVNTVAWLRAYV